jgi:hypothetical protein
MVTLVVVNQVMSPQSTVLISQMRLYHYQEMIYLKEEVV